MDYSVYMASVFYQMNGELALLSMSAENHSIRQAYMLPREDANSIALKNELIQNIWECATETTENPEIPFYADYTSVLLVEDNYRQREKPEMFYLTRDGFGNITSTSYRLNPTKMNIFFIGFEEDKTNANDPAIVAKSFFLSRMARRHGLDDGYLDALMVDNGMEEKFDELLVEVLSTKSEDPSFHQNFYEMKRYLQPGYYHSLVFI